MIRTLIRSILFSIVKLVILNLIFYYAPFIPISKVNPCLIAPCPESVSVYTPREALENARFFMSYVEKIGAHRAGTESFRDAVERVLNQNVFAGNAVLLAILTFLTFRKGL